jgi:hypothetical protein
MDKQVIEECKSFEELVNLLNKNHVDGNDPKYNGDHVYLVYSDGEICSTKAGELFMQRGLHQAECGVLKKSQCMKGFCDDDGKYGKVCIPNVPHETLRNKIIELRDSIIFIEEKISRKNEIPTNTFSLKPIKIGGNWQLEDSPEILKMYFWGFDKEWKNGHVSGREWKLIRYMLKDIELAIDIQLQGFGQIIEMKYTDDNKVEITIECLELY